MKRVSKEAKREVRDQATSNDVVTNLVTNVASINAIDWTKWDAVIRIGSAPYLDEVKKLEPVFDLARWYRANYITGGDISPNESKQALDPEMTSRPDSNPALDKRTCPIVLSKTGMPGAMYISKGIDSSTIIVDGAILKSRTPPTSVYTSSIGPGGTKITITLDAIDLLPISIVGKGYSILFTKE